MHSIVEAIGDVIVPTISSSGSPFEGRTLFNQLDQLTAVVAAKAAVLLLQHLRATVVLELNLSLTYREAQDRHCTGELLRVLAHFTELRHRMLVNATIVQWQASLACF
jgi:hypothetical protein